MDSILNKYPDRVPVYVNKKEKSNIGDVEKHKYLVPKNMTMGNFIYILRKSIKLKSDQALFVFVNNVIVCNSELMSEIYNMHYDKNDKFLYVTYSGENTFG
jgi:GABA(A) receptor-associated protein